MVKEMKHTEIGDIPADWEVQTFEETFRVLSNNTLSRAELNDRGGTVQNVHYGDILTRFTEVLDCSNEDIPFLNDTSSLTASAMPLQDGDVILADTAEDEAVGKATEIAGLGDKKLVSGLHTIPCRVKKGDFAPGWLGYYMNSHAYHDQVLPFVTGIKVSSISKSAIAETLVLVPPIEEQKAIVKSLNEIEILIKNLEGLIAKRKAIKQGMLERMFPRKGQALPEIRIPGFTDAWEQRKLGEVAEKFEYGLNVAATEFDGINKYIRITDIDDESRLFLQDGVTSPDTNLEIAKNYILRRGDILFARTGASVGKSYIYKDSDGLVYYAGFLIRCHVKEDNNEDFIFQNTLTESYNKYIQVTSQRSGQPGVNAKEYQEFSFYVPAKEEQDRIAEYLSCLDTLITLHQRELEKYKAIKQGMMSELLTGKIRLV